MAGTTGVTDPNLAFILFLILILLFFGLTWSCI